MISSIKFEKYRKLENINIEFNKGINVISGGNGTCKTSLLHIISNSFKAVTLTQEIKNKLNDEDSIAVIKNINKLINPKIESLTRGDEQYNDPAIGVTGTLYTCKYTDKDFTLKFRRHNSSIESKKKRFAIKPKYSKKGEESLPMLPVIYLGIFRLFAFGEFQEDNDIKKISRKMPNKYLDEVIDLYKEFTGQTIDMKYYKKMGPIKNRVDFSTDVDGIDSNTISAGEDNLVIILTALVSLKYYFESFKLDERAESILLIDEIDATLHPEYQLKLYDKFSEYSKNYNIQIVFTTHSLTLLEYALEKKAKVVYLLDNNNSVYELPSPNISLINMFLKNKTNREIYLNNKIPIYTEDEEARKWIELLFEYYRNERKIDLNSIFHLVNMTASSQVLINIASDEKLKKNSIRIITILDGDQNTDLNNMIVMLPGGGSPEDVIFNYVDELLNYNKYKTFWENKVIMNHGYTFKWCQSKFKKEIEDFSNMKKRKEELEKCPDKKIENLKKEIKIKEKEIKIENLKLKIETKETKEEIQETKEEINILKKSVINSTKGKTREFNKKIFSKNLIFCQYVIKQWIEDAENKEEVDKFFKNLYICFKKTAIFNNIDKDYWKDDRLDEKL